MVGGVWLPDNPGNTFLELNDGFNSSAVKKAVSMCDFVLWDPSARKKRVLSVCAMPLEHSFAGAGATSRGNLYVCHLVGQVLEASFHVVKGVLCDSHGTHQYTKKLLFGDLDTLPMDDILQLPFWKRLTWKELPPHDLPRLPVKVAMCEGSPIWGIPGVCLLAGSGQVELEFCIFDAHSHPFCGGYLGNELNQFVLQLLCVMARMLGFVDPCKGCSMVVLDCLGICLESMGLVRTI